MPGRRDRGLVPDSRHHIVQRPALRRVVEREIGSEDRQPVCARQRIQAGDPGQVVAGIEIAGRHMPQRRQQAGQVGKNVRERCGPNGVKFLTQRRKAAKRFC